MKITSTTTLCGTSTQGQATMCGHEYLFKEMQKIEDGHVSFGDASNVEVKGRGTIHFLQKDGVMGSIQDVYYVPDLKTNILSMGQLTEKGYSIFLKDRLLHQKDKQGRLVARVEIGRNHMYKLNLRSIREKCLRVDVEDKASLCISVLVTYIMAA